jgi:hypothetical protein
MAGRQGFASMDPDKQRKIASLGGKKSHGGGRPRKMSGGATRST